MHGLTSITIHTAMDSHRTQTITLIRKQDNNDCLNITLLASIPQIPKQTRHSLTNVFGLNRLTRNIRDGKYPDCTHEQPRIQLHRIHTYPITVTSPLRSTPFREWSIAGGMLLIGYFDIFPFMPPYSGVGTYILHVPEKFTFSFSRTSLWFFDRFWPILRQGGGG